MTIAGLATDCEIAQYLEVYVCIYCELHWHPNAIAIANAQLSLQMPQVFTYRCVIDDIVTFDLKLGLPFSGNICRHKYCC